VRKRIAIALLVLLIVSVVGLFVSLMLVSGLDEFDAYGEVPIPGTRTLHLPAGDVRISFHSVYPQGLDPDKCMPIPQDLEVTITPPTGVSDPKVTTSTAGICDNNTDNDEGRSPVRVAHITQAGDYTITTNGKVTPFANPRLAFGHPSRWWFLPWLFGGLCVVSLFVFLPVMPWWAGSRSASGRTASAAGPKPDISAAELRASGQRVRGVLKSFTPTGDTVRSRGATVSRPEFLDYPYYALVVELQLPNLAPVVGRNRQPVPLTEVPKLAIGRELNCAVDRADPASRFVVDWS
jgi:hypothetical protein